MRPGERGFITDGDQGGITLDPADAADLLTRAEVMAGDGDLIAIVEDVLAGAEQAGADPGCVEGLLGALRLLDPGAIYRYDAGDATDLRVNTGYGSEWEFLEGVSDAEDQVEQRHREATTLLETAAALLENAQSAGQSAASVLAEARQELSAAYAMPTREPCGGCHAAKQAAISAGESAESAAEAAVGASSQVMATAEAAIAVLEPYAAALVIAVTKIRRVPADLGDTYEVVHAFLRSGGKLPPAARFIQGSAHGVA